MMKRVPSIGWLVSIGVAGAVVALGAAGQGQRPVFRAASNLVAVPVSVEDGNTPVTGLTAADFELRDNGIVQTIELVAGETTPVDLTVAIDTDDFWYICPTWPIEYFCSAGGECRTDTQACETALNCPIQGNWTCTVWGECVEIG
jgi:hypothetical protein